MIDVKASPVREPCNPAELDWWWEQLLQCIEGHRRPWQPYQRRAVRQRSESGVTATSCSLRPLLGSGGCCRRLIAVLQLPKRGCYGVAHDRAQWRALRDSAQPAA
eukprot:361330-Chlamydomonas_euryale.AAC.9